MDELPDDSKFTVKKIVAALLVKHSVELAVRKCKKRQPHEKAVFRLRIKL
jgi:hypothetical protein